MLRAHTYASRFSVLALGAATLISPAVLTAAAAETPFSQLAGTWSGSGTAQLEGGKTESLRCKGYYTNGADGAALGLSIRCANASAKVELRANLNYANGAVSGSWEERTYNQSGTISGKANGNKMNLAITGGIEGSMSVSVADRHHSVTVSTAASALKGINISMSR